MLVKSNWLEKCFSRVRIQKLMQLCCTGGGAVSEFHPNVLAGFGILAMPFEVMKDANLREQKADEARQYEERLSH